MQFEDVMIVKDEVASSSSGLASSSLTILQMISFLKRIKSGDDLKNGK